MKFDNATKFNRKSGVAEGSAVHSTSSKLEGSILSLQMNCHPDRSGGTCCSLNQPSLTSGAEHSINRTGGKVTTETHPLLR
jgi:hypothetical protein